MSSYPGLEQLIVSGGDKDLPEALDTIRGSGPASDLPTFFIDALRRIVYRLKLAGMWQDNYDIRLHIPNKYLTEFVYILTKYVFDLQPKTEVEKIINDDFITIDGIKIRLDEIQVEVYPEFYYLAVYSIGQNQLIIWDDILGRWLFRAPWAIARYEVKE